MTTYGNSSSIARDRQCKKRVSFTWCLSTKAVPMLHLSSTDEEVAARLAFFGCCLGSLFTADYCSWRRIRKRCMSKARLTPDPRFVEYLATLVGAPVIGAAVHAYCAMATRSFPRCSTPSAGRNGASASRASSMKTARSAISSPQRSSTRPARRHGSHRARCHWRRAVA